MALTPEELLKPRFKLVADYPNNNSPIGRIFGHNVNGTVNKMPLEEWLEWHNKYPAIFKPLQWWEERTVDEMPSYVKDTGHNTYEKVVRYDGAGTTGSSWMRMVIGQHSWAVIERVMCFFEPATETDYNSYLKNK